jgi:DNA-binding response OmpR family regulator
MKAKILWVEGKRADSPSFVSELRKKEYDIETAQTGSAAVARLKEYDPDMVVVNAASLRTSGKRICCELRQEVNGLPVLLISNPEQPLTDDSCAHAVLSQPFTLRKLLNAMNNLLPGDGKLLLHVGPVRLDLEKRRVRCQGREHRLTPRLAKLLQILIQKPGVVIEREDLFRQVWQTEYTGDTRTLDVHISWLREAIEQDPRNPKFLRTIRGVGYRFDV